jgi:addiction module HigA family antidote
MKTKDIPPIHPGIILFEEFLEPLKITQYRLAEDTNIPLSTINEIVHGNRPITADIALRLGKFFNMTPQFWMNLQSRYDIEMAEDELSDKLDNEVHPYQESQAAYL